MPEITAPKLGEDLLFTDALYDIGKAGATRPRDLFLSRNLTVSGATAVQALTATTGSFAGVVSPASDNTRDLGTTALRWRSLYLSSTVLVGTTTATNMGDGDLRGSAIWLADAMAAPTATANFAAIYVDTADGDLKVKFGDGTVKTLATDT